MQRIGVFVCHCGTNIAGTVDVKAVAEALDGLPDYKMHCSVLAEEAIQAALEDYYEKNPDKKPAE